MPSFGSKSESHLSECHIDMQELMREVVKIVDCSIIEGHRSEEEQNKLFHAGRSKVQWPNSKHNSTPSMAVDVVPYPIDWNDKERFYYFSGIVIGVANRMSVSIRWGGDWNGNHSWRDQAFHDLPHFELKL